MGSQLCQEWMYFQSYGNCCSPSSRVGEVQLYWVSRKVLYTWFIYLFNSLHQNFTILHDLTTLCSNEHVTKPWAKIQGHIFSLVVCCGTLTVVDIGIEEHLVTRVLVLKKTAWVRWRIRWWHGYRNNLRSHHHTKWFLYHPENLPFHMGMWKILLGAVSQYSEQ